MKKQKISMKNTYTIYKVVDGKKQEITRFHSIVTNQMKKHLATQPSVRLHSIWFGDGNKEPSEADTALSHPLWTTDWNNGNIISMELPAISEDNTWNYYFTGKIAASPSFVGTVSELAIYGSYGSSSYLYMFTHALIKDAEGNPMTITKTDTEELLVDVHIEFQLSGGTEFEWIPWYPYVHAEKGSGAHIWIQIPSLGYIRIEMLRAYPDLMSSGNLIGTRQQVTQKWDADKNILTCSQGRFLADNQQTQEYVNAIGLAPGYHNSTYDSYLTNVPIGVWKFPNPEIFPNTTLSDMEVGIGDGETTEFIPPLNLWVKNTERIYVDGVLQVRDVDYTCDHRNNLSELQSLRPSNFSKLRTEIARMDTPENNKMGVHPLKGSYNGLNTKTFMYLIWDKDHPLEWELQEDPQIGIEADYFQMNGIQHTGGNYCYWLNAIFTLSYSKDREEWTDIGMYIVTAKSTNRESYKFEFPETIAAKYWRLSADVSGCSESLKNSRFFATEISYLHRNGSPICFTNPPAEGAVITMEADIDRPMKNDKFILDVNPCFSL